MDARRDSSLSADIQESGHDSRCEPNEDHGGDSAKLPLEKDVDIVKTSEGDAKIMMVLNRLKTRLRATRIEFVKGKLATNRGKLMLHNYGMMSKILPNRLERNEKSRSTFPVKKLYFAASNINSDDPLSLNLSFAGKSITKDLRTIETILHRPQYQVPPRYTTWVFTDRNRRLVEGQSVEDKIRIYYDRDGNETARDYEPEDGQQSHDHEHYHNTVQERAFTANEDFMILMATQEYGVSDALFQSISAMMNRKLKEIEGRYKLIMSNERFMSRLSVLVSASELISSKKAEACVSFDTCGSDVFNTKRGSHDHQMRHVYSEVTAKLEVMSFQDKSPSETTSWDEVEQPRFLPHLNCNDSDGQFSCEHNQESYDDGKDSEAEECEKLVAALNCLRVRNQQLHKYKTQFEADIQPRDPEDLASALSSFENLFCRVCLVFDCHLHGYSLPLNFPSSAQRPETSFSKDVSIMPCGANCHLLGRNLEAENLKGSSCDDKLINNDEAGPQTKIDVDVHRREAAKLANASSSLTAITSETWNNLEVDLFNKGLQIFGKRSCLIAQNFLKGCKTCAEVANRIAIKETPEVVQDICSEDVKAKIPKKRGGRKIKFSQSSHGFCRKKAVYSEILRHQYYPCICSSGCGDQCSCRERRTKCEKYCGCSRLCTNGFSGCQCGKSQCSNKLCPCFFANRECDPDVCRNCSLKCEDILPGDTSTISARKFQSNCLNMRMLLNKKKSVLLARSDVSGWGLFLKDSASTNEYLGEYTGELISQLEADKRGQIYDMVDLSFLFDLNDMFVIDAYRLGNKFKFANHSSKPNCYPKVMKVGGQHRVGIFAKRKIEPGEELLFDYQYEKQLGERTPEWAQSSKEKKVGLESRSNPANTNSGRKALKNA